MNEFLKKHEVKIDKAGFCSAVEKLESLVNDGVSENELQKHIERHQYILSQQFAHCRYVFPKVALGNQYETDFMCLEIPSSGKEWIGVELENPNKKVITKTGRRTAVLEHAIQQIRDWRTWVTENLSYAQKEKDKNGLGLIDINPRFYGYVIIGRRNNFNEKFNELRRQIQRDELVIIRSWDGVIEWAFKRAKYFSYIVDSQKIIYMQQELTEKQKKYNDLKTILSEIKHLEEVKNLLDKNMNLNRREYKRKVLKIEENFSNKAKQSISFLLNAKKTFDDIYNEVQHLIPQDIPLWLFKEYLTEKINTNKT